MSIDAFLTSLDKDKLKSYQDYWEKIKPNDNTEIFKRWVFALCSIRTTWQRNVFGYEALTKDLSWVIDHNKIEPLIKSTGLGLVNVRAKALTQFAKLYVADPNLFVKNAESWMEYRDRLSKKLFGIGKAKTAFAIEMIYPSDAEVVCLDTHILKSLGWTKRDTPSEKIYNKLESQWLEKCKSLNAPSAMIRHMYWDTIHNKSDTRYWSYCLEK